MNTITVQTEVDKVYYQYIDPNKVTIGRGLRLNIKLARATWKCYNAYLQLLPGLSSVQLMRLARHAAWFSEYPNIYVRHLTDSLYKEIYRNI